jgi:hypothetical protein
MFPPILPRPTKPICTLLSLVVANRRARYRFVCILLGVREALVRAMLAATLVMGLAASSASAETLGATNVVSGSTTSYVDVELPSPVVVHFDEDPVTQPSFKVEGGGPFAGIALYQLGRSDFPAVAVAGRFQKDLVCVTDSCPELFSAAGQSTGEQLAWDPQEATLAPGRYRLLLVSDGTPVRATIKLPELSGSKTFTPTNPTHTHTVTSLERIDPFPMDNLDVFTGKSTLDSHGIVFMTARIDTVENSGEIDVEVCNYDRTEPDALDFYPGCTSATDQDSGLVYAHSYIAANQPVSLDWAFELGKGDWRTGGNVRVLGGIESSAWAALFLPTHGPAVAAAPVAEPPAAVAPPAAAGSGPSAAMTPGFGRIALAPKARLRGKRAAFKLTCAGGPCRGTLALKGSRIAYELAAGAKKTVTLKLRRSVKRGRVKVMLAETARPARAVSVTLR